MWTLNDASKIVGTQMRVESYKRHLSQLKAAKPQLRIEAPFRPGFSLSKRKNKYSKYQQMRVEKENENLLKRMVFIDQREKSMMTWNDVPPTVPSNKDTYAAIRCRERRAHQFEINRENLKIFSKIENINSDYCKTALDSEWVEVKKYRDNISRKDSFPDYQEMARELEFVERSRITRPRTALPK